DAAERLDLAGVCQAKTLHAAAARLYAAAFAVYARLADDLDARHRYYAACEAALAGCGQGKDADKFDAKERARLRGQALGWLRDDLEAWGRLLDKEPDKPRAAARVTEVLQHWLADTDFSGVRGPVALARLPEVERQPWQKLWGDVTDTLARVQGKPPPEK